MPGPLDYLSQGLMAIFGAQNPQAFSSYAAAKGIAPPGSDPSMTGTADPYSLASTLEPQPQSALAGVKAPPAPAFNPVGTPGAPSPSQAIAPPASLLDLLLKAQQAPGTAAPATSLSAILGGGRR